MIESAGAKSGAHWTFPGAFSDSSRAALRPFVALHPVYRLQIGKMTSGAICYRGLVLPELSAPEARLYKRQTASVFIWGSFVTCSIFGWTPIRLPEAFENAVLWNWSCGDSNRRPNAARAAMYRQSEENPPGGAQGPFAAGLRSNGGADPARNPATRAGDPRVLEQRPGTTDSELAGLRPKSCRFCGAGNLARSRLSDGSLTPMGKLSHRQTLAVHRLTIGGQDTILPRQTPAAKTAGATS